MRRAFQGYYVPTAEQFESLWSSATIVLDANVLLNLFRYSSTTREQFLGVLEGYVERLWLPHQVAQEFHENRIQVIAEQPKAILAVRTSILDAKKQIEATLGKHKTHPTFDAEALLRRLTLAHDSLVADVDSAMENYENLIEREDFHGRTFSRITSLYENRVGQKWSKADLEAIYKEGERRYSLQMPPGYEDAKKQGNNKYGDLILWRQILEYGSTEKAPVIFVTDDRKEDWWRVISGRTYGARPELVDEYREASDQLIHFYNPEQFIKHAVTDAGAATGDTLLEVARVSLTSWLEKEEEASHLAQTNSAISKREQSEYGPIVLLSLRRLRSLDDEAVLHFTSPDNVVFDMPNYTGRLTGGVLEDLHVLSKVFGHTINIIGPFGEYVIYSDGTRLAYSPDGTPLGDGGVL